MAIEKDFMVTAKCPHCLEENNFVISLPRSYSHGFALVRCWNSEKQVGCLKEMTLNQQIKVWTDATSEQKREKAEKDLEEREKAEKDRDAQNAGDALI